MSDLSGVTVVVTRPEHQATVLCQSIETLGGLALCLPVIEIRPSSDVEALKAQLKNLSSFQLAIFVSANAVAAVFQNLEPQYCWPSGVAIAAVGQATARAINEHGLSVSLISPEPYNSEALLSISELQILAGQRVIIFRGNGGRDLLGNTLQERGAAVEYAECYQRVMPETDMSALYRQWDDEKVIPIVVASNESLHNLHAMIDDSYQHFLLRSPIIVVSQRAVALANELGFSKVPMVAKNASNDAIMTVINQWKKS